MTVDHASQDDRIKAALETLAVAPADEDFWTSVRFGIEAAAQPEPVGQVRRLGLVAPTGSVPVVESTMESDRPSTVESAAAQQPAAEPSNQGVERLARTLPGAVEEPRHPDRLRFLALAAGLCLIAGLGTFLATSGGARPAVVATDSEELTAELTIDHDDRSSGDDAQLIEDGEPVDLDQMADGEINRGPIVFESGATSATVSGRVDGEAVDVWTFVAAAGQTGRIELQQGQRTDLTGTFVIWAPSGQTVTTEYVTDEVSTFVLPEDGPYQLRLLRYRAGLRPEGSFEYTATLTIDPVVEAGAGGEAMVQEAGIARLTIGDGVDQPYEVEGCTVDDGVISAGLFDLADPDQRIDLLDGELVISGGPDDVGAAEILAAGPIVEIVGELEMAGPFRLVIFGCDER